MTSCKVERDKNATFADNRKYSIASNDVVSFCYIPGNPESFTMDARKSKTCGSDHILIPRGGMTHNGNWYFMTRIARSDYMIHMNCGCGESTLNRSCIFGNESGLNHIDGVDRVMTCGIYHIYQLGRNTATTCHGMEPNQNRHSNGR